MDTLLDQPVQADLLLESEEEDSDKEEAQDISIVEEEALLASWQDDWEEEVYGESVWDAADLENQID